MHFISHDYNRLTLTGIDLGNIASRLHQACLVIIVLLSVGAELGRMETAKSTGIQPGKKLRITLLGS